MNRVTLGEICTLYGGGTPSTKNPAYWGGNLKWLSSAESGKDFIYDSNVKITELGVKESATKLAKKNSVLIATAGEGKTRGQVSFLETDAYINQSLISMSSNSEVTNLFLYYYLKNSYKRLRQLSDITGVRGSLSGDLLKTFVIEYPDIDIQNKITSFLRKIDLKIETNNNINSQLESLSKTLYDYWFLQFEFPNEEGKPYKSSGGKMVWNEDLKREIPEGWENCVLGDFYKSQSGYAFKSTEWKNTGHPVLTIKAIEGNGNVNMDEASFISERYNDSLNKYSAKNGNLIFAMSGNTIGKIGLIASSVQNILINQRVLIIDTSAQNVAYPYFTLICPEIQNKIRQLGANSAQPNISESQLNDIKVVKPDSHILNIYNDKCAPMFKQIISNRIQNQQLSSLRDWLLPMLMNGQVTFKSEE